MRAATAQNVPSVRQREKERKREREGDIGRRLFIVMSTRELLLLFSLSPILSSILSNSP
jgi:hypothetical protein